MQNRMKNHILEDNQVKKLLNETEIGSLAMLNKDGSPYVIPVHFVYMDKRIYIHGLPKGRKIDNINNDRRVSLCVYKMIGLLLDEDEDPCDTNTEYESVVVMGNATIIKDLKVKEKALNEVVKKYTPHLAHKEIPLNMLKGTAVIELEISEITGKYYK